MRAIANFTDQKLAKQFSAYLRSKKIENTCEIILNKSSQKIECVVWVREEDQVNEALKLYEEFQKNPSAYQAPKHNKPAISAIHNPKIILEEKEENQKRFILTYLLLGFCIFIYFFNTLEALKINKKSGKFSLFSFTQIEKLFLFDFPKAFSNYHNIPVEFENQEQIKEEMKKLDQLPFFHGFYPKIVSLLSNKPMKEGTGPLFEKIRKGEVWRLVSPSFLHRDLLHILFNMLWLWLLCRQIEERLKPFRLLVFVLAAAAISNIAQYLVSGPLFVGFSGVITAMAGFIWIRKKIAPWEGYPLPNGTLVFLAVFVLAMVFLQVAGFFFETFSTINFQLRIANTGHIVGALAGMAFGYMPFFARRVT